MTDTTIIQNGTNVNPLSGFIATLECGNRGEVIAAQVLKGTNEKALDILKVLGCKGFFPEIEHINISYLAKFYGLTSGYLYGVLQNRKITVNTFPEDVYNVTTASGFQKKFNISSDWVLFEGYRTIEAKSEIRKAHFIISPERMNKFISARLALALAAIMFYGRVIVNNSVATKVLEALDNSSYAEAAEAVIREHMAFLAKTEAENKAKSEEQQASKTEDASVGEVEISADGKVTMSADVLTSIVSKSVKDALEAYLNNAKLACANFKAVQEKPVVAESSQENKPTSDLCEVTVNKYEFFDHSKRMFVYHNAKGKKRVCAKTLEELRKKEAARGITHDSMVTRVVLVPEMYAPTNKI